MKNEKIIARWAAGTAVTLSSISLAQAQTYVRAPLNHDMTTSLDGVDFGYGLGSDIGQWAYLSAYNTVWIDTVGQSFTTSSILATWQISGNINARAGSDYAGGLQENVLNDIANGLVAWNLANGTKGWLAVSAEHAPGVPLLTADNFVYDLDNPGIRPVINRSLGGDQFNSLDVVPEPSSMALLACGAAGVMLRRRR